MRIRQRHSLWGVTGPMMVYQRELILNWHRSNGVGSQHRLVQSSGESSVAADVGAQSPKACIRRVKSELEDLAALKLVVGGKRGAEELDGDLGIAAQGSLGFEDHSALAVSKEVESEECGRGHVAKKPRLAESEDVGNDVPEVRSGNRERDDRGKNVAGDVRSDSVKEEDEAREIEKGTVLLQAMHQVFAEAGIRGLTVRKAVDLIVEAGLAGFKEDGAAERAAVGKIVRESPTFTRLTRKTFALLSAFPEDNRPSLWTSSPHVAPESMDDGEEMCDSKGENVKSKGSGGDGLSQAGTKRMRKGTKVRRMGCITQASPEGSGQGAAFETNRETPSAGTRTTDWVNVRSTTPELQERSSPSYAEWSKIRVEVVSAEVPAPVPQSVQGDEGCGTPDESAVTMLEERFSDSRSDESHLGGLSAHMTHHLATEHEPSSPMNGPDTILASRALGKPCVSQEAIQTSLCVKDYAGEPLHTVTVDQANEPFSLLEGPETVITEVEGCGQTRGSTRPLDDCFKQESVPECRPVKVVSTETQSPPSLKVTAVALTNELLGGVGCAW